MDSTHTISLIVNNQSGVLSRIAGLFTRRGYNIDSLSVGETEEPGISRMTICFTGDQQTLEQVKKQCHKLVDVIKVIDMTPEDSIFRELILVKIALNDRNRNRVIDAVKIYRGNVINYTRDAAIIELTGDRQKIDAFISLVESEGIQELIRTGFTSLKR